MEEHLYATKRRVYWAVIVVVGGNLMNVLVRGFRMDATYALLIAGLWLVALTLATFQNLRRLEALERGNPEPTAATRWLSHLTVMLPILGSIPVSFGLY
jgi:hypothetical protein